MERKKNKTEKKKPTNQPTNQPFLSLLLLLFAFRWFGWLIERRRRRRRRERSTNLCMALPTFLRLLLTFVWLY